MPEKVYRVGVIGCGRIGSERDPDPPIPLTHAGAFHMLPQAKVVAGTNRGRERLEAFGRKWGVSALYHDHREMLEKENLDIVCIATHPELHEDEVIDAAEAGVKGIFCEKPIAISLAEADAMIDACDRASAVLLINHSRRWDPAYHKARELVEEGAIDEKKIKVPAPLPGPLAHSAAGLVGLLCVIIAGWTTANPTIYRAGLAFQAILPKSSRFKVTLLTGAAATIAGMFPAIAMKPLEFVALYGLILMPMGAVIFVDFWLIRKFGLASSYAELSGKTFNWAAGLAWFVTLATAWLLVKFAGIQIFFVSLPGWFVAAILYILLSKFYQNKVRPSAAA